MANDDKLPPVMCPDDVWSNLRVLSQQRREGVDKTRYDDFTIDELRNGLNGAKVIDLQPSVPYDEGVIISFDNGSTLHIGYSGDEGVMVWCPGDDDA